MQKIKIGNVIMNVRLSMLIGWLGESCCEGDGYLRSDCQAGASQVKSLDMAFPSQCG